MTLRVAMGTGYAVRVSVSASSGFDPLAVSNPRLIVRKPGGERATWSGTISSATSLAVVANIPFPSAEEPSISGEWSAYVLFDAPGGTRRSDPFTFPVDAEF